MQTQRSYSNKGMTILELLIVISIISIIFYLLSTTFYEKFKSEAYLTKDAMVYAKNCLSDLVIYCINHQNALISANVSPNCQNRTSLYGNITVSVPQEHCNGSELPDNFTVKFYSSLSQYYYIRCVYQTNKGIHCAVEPR